MYIAATSACFQNLPLNQAARCIAELEYSNIEIMVHESGGHLRPSEVAADLPGAYTKCRDLSRLVPVALSLDISAENMDEYFRQFTACCMLAKSLNVMTIILRAADRLAPFNLEIEKYRKCVSLAVTRGIEVCLLTEKGRMADDPETIQSLCHNSPGLKIALDPSYFIYEPVHGKGYESLLSLVGHVRLRDTSPKQFQVRVGQGNMEFGQLVSQLILHDYKRAVSVDLHPDDSMDLIVEMRKMRLLLESLLI